MTQQNDRNKWRDPELCHVYTTNLTIIIYIVLVYTAVRASRPRPESDARWAGVENRDTRPPGLGNMYQGLSQLFVGIRQSVSSPTRHYIPVTKVRRVTASCSIRLILCMFILELNRIIPNHDRLQ